VGVLKYPFYIACVLFAVLTVYSVNTEKPKQFKAKQIDEIAPANTSRPMAQLWNADETIATALSPNKANSAVTAKPGAQKLLDPAVGKSTPQAPAAQTNTNAVVVAYSNNDVGGKIVLTINKCEKLPGTVAYTTAPDGKVDYGCWTFDELYIVINWDKAGINNYTYDKFFDISSNERLLPKHLFEVAKESISKPKVVATPATPATPATTPTPPPVTPATPSPGASQVTSNSTGGKK